MSLLFIHSTPPSIMGSQLPYPLFKLSSPTPKYTIITNKEDTMGTEEVAALISGVMATWFTPSSIFIVLNLVIGTIFIRSRFGAPIVQVAVTVATVTAAPIKQIPHHLPKLLRAPTLLHRITPFNSHQHAQTREYTHPQLVPTPTPTQTSSLTKRVKAFNFVPTQTELEIPCPNPEKPQERRLASPLQRLHSIEVSSLKRSESLDGEKEGEMEGSDSESEGERQLREDEEDAESGRRQLREDQAEDAKADDFISSFKKELRLQRVNSYLDYEQMLKGN